MMRALMTPVYLHAIHTALPRKSLSQAESIEKMAQLYRQDKTVRLLRRLLRHTAIERRYLAALDFEGEGGGDPLYRPDTEQPAGPGMGVRSSCFDRAADELIVRVAAGMEPQHLQEARSLVTVSCTHASSPGLERPLFSHTTLSHDVHRWNLGFMGCSAGLGALRLVQGLAPPLQSAIVLTCELSSLHFQYSDDVDQITANALFADGAAMVALSPRPGPVAVLATASVHLPEAASQMEWWADDHGLRLHLARELPETIGANLPQAVHRFLGRCEVPRGGIDHWLVHPGGPQILDSVEAALELGPEALTASRGVLRDCGNMSSSTILFILDRLMCTGATGKALAVAFGPGLTIELALLELNPSSV